MQNWQQRTNQYINEYTLEQRKSWYSNAADAYNRTRPRYPQAIISRVVELTNLSPDSNILELGCGPGTATTSFAKFGCSMTCLEPSLEACEIARQNCIQYPNVEIINTTFEEWELTSTHDAVLAANSFHWISSEIKYIKTANALKTNGFLILLWNITFKPQDEVYQILHEIYQREAPTLSSTLHQDGGREIHEAELGKFGQAIIDSGLYHNLMSEHFSYELTYSIDDYLALLGTFSPCIALESHLRDSLFSSMKQELEKNWGKSFQVPCLASFHIAKKI
jgi:cyclopropane fatty-acyl-phospholipid synthase-like methyltransferase